MDNRGLVAVLFAGCGGACTGLEAALGRQVDIAINHSSVAIAVHKANHPKTRHYTTDVWEVDPLLATKGRPVDVLWLSPDCRDFSSAKGGKPRSKKIRSLAWVGIRWAKDVQPAVIFLENVIEFEGWGPLDKHGNRIPARKGETFRRWVGQLRRLGYVVEWRVLDASQYGAPTKRRRLFLVARRDGLPIRWPVPTHGDGGLFTQPLRTAAECIDWTIACPSIFGRARNLARPIMARVARGANTFILQKARAFVVTLRGGEDSHIASSVSDVDQPLRTISAGGTHHAVVAPYLVHRSNGERVGQAPRIYDPLRPLGTIVAQGQKHALCAAYLVKNYGGHESSKGGSPLDAPVDTITAKDHHSLVAAYLVRYNGTGGPIEADAPMGALTSRPRFGLVEGDLAPTPLTPEQVAGARRVAAFLREHGYDVGEMATVTVDGIEYVIVDIGLRMLKVHELLRAQFGKYADGYDLSAAKTQAAKVELIGNSVSPETAEALVRANVSGDLAERVA